MNVFKQFVKTIYYFPLVITYLCGIGGVKVRQDLEYANETCRFFSNKNKYILFLTLISQLPEWRQVYLMRIGRIGRLFSIIYAKNILLAIHCDDIDGGLFIQHGHSTEINAKKIGRNCQIWQNVTIGVKYSGGETPVIGNNVKISAGACVLGGINIGDNVTVGANAVVLNDVPENCIAVGVPAKIIRQHNDRSEENC